MEHVAKIATKPFADMKHAIYGNCPHVPSPPEIGGEGGRRPDERRS